MEILILLGLLAVGLAIWRSVERHRARPVMDPQELGRVLEEARRKADDCLQPPDEHVA